MAAPSAVRLVRIACHEENAARCITAIASWTIAAVVGPVTFDGRSLIVVVDVIALEGGAADLACWEEQLRRRVNDLCALHRET